MGAEANAVFARVASRPIPRVLRMMRVARELGFTPEFCGAYREEDLQETEVFEGQKVVRIGRYWPLLGGRGIGTYLHAVLQFNRALYRHLKARRPGLVHASDIETLPGAALFCFRTDSRLVYNIHDNWAQRYRIPAILAWLLNFLEGLGVLASDVAVVPEAYRRQALPSWCRSKVQIVRNTPEDVGFTTPQNRSDKIRIFFGGWLDWGRGLGQLMSLCEQTPGFELTVAGEGSLDVVAELQRHPHTRFLGFLPHSQVIEETRRCHFVAALYDPVRPINRYAAPNKLAEALCVGRPVILNRETEVAQEYKAREFVVLTEYASADSLGDRLRAMIEDYDSYTSACSAARRAYEEKYAWAPVRAQIEQALGERRRSS